MRRIALFTLLSSLLFILTELSLRATAWRSAVLDQASLSITALT